MIVLVAEGLELCEARVVRMACGLGNSMIPALQEAHMKVCVSHTRVLSSIRLAVVASFRNLSI